MKKTVKKIFSRFSLVALTIILLFVSFVAAITAGIILLNLLLVSYFPATEPYVSILLTVLSWLIVVIAVMHAANRDMVPETKIPWLLCIVALNIFGVAIYVTFSSHRPSRRARKRFRKVHEDLLPYQKRAIPRERLHAEMGHWAQASEALSATTPEAIVQEGTNAEYFPFGEAMMPRYLEDLRSAEKFIFLEYFIIEQGAFFNAVLDILEEKAKAGVEVRLMYDDIGSMGKVRFNYDRELRKRGIRCTKFNPFVPVVSNIHNNRDHRKITVIDGKIGYTGGLNLADEYINATHPFGVWKDTAVRLEGQGVKNLTLIFLRLYDFSNGAEDISRYIPTDFEYKGDGFVQPFGDGPSPLYGRHVGEDLIINLIGAARRYLWLTTPYLIIDYRMREALILAAERGVDVRILTPHIPDKKIPFSITRSNYLALIRGGVKVYEYTPGFVHAKQLVADDDIALIGTINLDYRSFLYHFENAVFMYRTRAVLQMKTDMVATFDVSKRQTEEDAKRNVVWRVVCEVAKLFAPLF